MLSLKTLPAYLTTPALTALAAAPLDQHQGALFPWWESLIILLLVILLAAVLILWNASQPLEYAENISHAQHGGHESGDSEPAHPSAEDL